MNPPEKTPAHDVAPGRSPRGEEERPRGVSGPAVGWIVGISAFIIAGLLVYERWIAPRNYPEVETTLVQASMNTGARPVLTAQGFLSAEREARLAPAVAGRVVKLYFEEGSRVRQGDVLAVIKSDQIQAQLREAEARYTEAGRQYQRQRAMWREGITSRATLQAAEAELQAAKARKEEIESTLQETVVTAPFDGTIIDKTAEVGEVVSPVQDVGVSGPDSVARLADLSTLEVEAEVNEGNIARLKSGMPAEIVVDAFPDQSWRGFLRTIIPSADREKGVVKAKVAFANPSIGLLPEMRATVSFLEADRVAVGKAEQARIWIPSSAIVKDPAGSRVVVIDDRDKVVVRPVTTGEVRAGRIEVVTGLEEGERIVTSDGESLVEGQRVRAKSSER